MLQQMRSSAKYIWYFIILAFVAVFLFAQTSGLTSERVTRGTKVASVNGEDISYDTWVRAYQGRLRAEQEQRGKPLTLDEERRIEDATFNELVTDILLQQQYKRRGINVSDDEIVQAAQYIPQPDLARNPEFQTDGRFDIDKYRRFLASPVARQQGVLAGLESYYRAEIPRQKLFDQVASSVYVTDEQLWRAWQDSHDSAQVTFTALRPESVPDSAVKVTDAEIQAYFNAHQKELGDRPARAVVSVTRIPRVITAADSAAVRAHALALRAEILKGAKFEDVAKRESADSASAANGGSLGRGGPGRFVPDFEKAAYALKPGQVSEPVLTQFGYHLIKVDATKGDTLELRHILLPIQQSDSAAARTDRRADSLAAMSAGSAEGAKFDVATKRLGLEVARLTAVEGNPLTWNGRYVPSVSAWAFSGVKPGEVSDLIDSDDGYYLARLDSLFAGGKATLADSRDEIRRELLRQKKIALLVPQAAQVARSVTGSVKLEDAAKKAGLEVQKSPMFDRRSAVPGIGQANEAIGAAFGLPAGATSGPISTHSGVFVMRVDRRIPADSAAWLKQKKTQRDQFEDRLRQQRIQDFLLSLREQSKIVDRRKELQQATRAAAG